MMNKQSLNDLHVLLEQTFPNTTIPDVIDELKIGDFDEWDSLGNFNLLLAVEEFFEVRFSVEQMTEIKSIADIKTALTNLK